MDSILKLELYLEFVYWFKRLDFLQKYIYLFKTSFNLLFQVVGLEVIRQF